MSTKLNDIKKLIEMKAGEGFERLFGIKPPKVSIEINDTVKEYNNARSWWERASGASIQCNNTIGKIDDINDVDIPCYICGIPMTKEFDDQTPECEHILPIYQASLLLKLYHNESEDGKRVTKKEMNDYDKKMYNLEYKWSHACCNQIKSDLSFLTTAKNEDTKEEEYSMSKKNASTILNKIWEGQHGKCSLKIMTYIRKQYKTKDEFVKKRLEIIKKETMSPIVEQLNDELNKKDSTKGLYYLSILANSISSINRKNFEKAVQGNAYREPPNYSEMRIKAYTEISALVSGMFIKSFLKNKALTTNSIELLNVVTKSEIKFNRQIKSTSIASLVYESFIKDDITEKVSRIINKQTLFMDIFSISYNYIKKTTPKLEEYDITLQSILNASNALKYYILKYIITQKSKMEENAKKLRGRTGEQLTKSINSFYDEIDTSSKILLSDMFPQVNNEIKNTYKGDITKLNVVSNYVFDYVNYILSSNIESNSILKQISVKYYGSVEEQKLHEILVNMRLSYLKISEDKYLEKSEDDAAMALIAVNALKSLTENVEKDDEGRVGTMAMQAMNNRPDIKSKTPSQYDKEGINYLINGFDILDIEENNKKVELDVAHILGRDLGVKRGRESSNKVSNNKSSSAMDVVDSRKTPTPQYIPKSNTRKRRRITGTPNSMRTQGGMKTRKAKK